MPFPVLIGNPIELKSLGLALPSGIFLLTLSSPFSDHTPFKAHTKPFSIYLYILYQAYMISFP